MKHVQLEHNPQHHQAQRSAEQTMREALAFIATREPDNYAQTSVQHMVAFVQTLTGTARRALEAIERSQGRVQG